MPKNIVQKIIKQHLISGKMEVNEEVSIRIDQTLTQDATGTMAYLQFEAMGVSEVKTDLSVSYVDHNTLQMNFRNADDQQYLRTVAAKYGIVYSPSGTGICHQLHLENFAKPGVTLLGSDSHTPTAGGIGSLAVGAGGLSVALAMAGEPYTLIFPKVVRVWLTGQLSGWASAKDVILHLLSLRTVKGGVGKVFEFSGPGVLSLSVPERATITNMGAELGATTSIFPSDTRTREFLQGMGREEDWLPLEADEKACYNEEMTINLSQLEPLVAKPHMPDKVVKVSSLSGLKVQQVAIGSCTNSSFADLSLVAKLLSNKKICPETELLISPGSKQVLTMLAERGELNDILNSGARVLECACGPCIGMGGAPSSGAVSVRTFNRNFEARSGTKDAEVYLTSPQVAAQVALHGAFTDPKTWGEVLKLPYFPCNVPNIKHLFIFPSEYKKDSSDKDCQAQDIQSVGRANPEIEIIRGSNIVSLEPFAALPEQLQAEVVLKTSDNITTDHIMPAGAEITALRSNIPAISDYVFGRLDKDFAVRAKKIRDVHKKHGAIIAGENYGQGSSREHAALAPRYLGIRVVIAKSFARIHRANLVNFGILPLIFADHNGYDIFVQGQNVFMNLKELRPDEQIRAEIADVSQNTSQTVLLKNDLTASELAIIQAGGMLNFVNNKA